MRRLLAANALVYLLSITLFTGRWFIDLLVFSPAGATRQPWTFVTYMFVHLGFLHLAFNMLMLFVFGTAVEDRMGRAFAPFYLLCGLGGAVFSYVIGAFTFVDPFGGASAAVFGVAIAFAYYWPDAELYVFPLPFPVKAKWLVAFLVTLDLLSAAYLARTGGSDGTAHLAHLGGFIVAFLYLKAETAWETRGQPPVTLRRTARVLVHPAAQESRPAAPPRPSRPPTAAQEEVDRVLDKISASGLGSLTPEERRFLDDFSRQMREQ